MIARMSKSAGSEGADEASVGVRESREEGWPPSHSGSGASSGRVIPHWPKGSWEPRRVRRRGLRNVGSGMGLLPESRTAASMRGFYQISRSERRGEPPALHPAVGCPNL